MNIITFNSVWWLNPLFVLPKISYWYIFAGSLGQMIFVLKRQTVLQKNSMRSAGDEYDSSNYQNYQILCDSFHWCVQTFNSFKKLLHLWYWLCSILMATYQFNSYSTNLAFSHDTEVTWALWCLKSLQTPVGGGRVVVMVAVVVVVWLLWFASSSSIYQFLSRNDNDTCRNYGLITSQN